MSKKKNRAPEEKSPDPQEKGWRTKLAEGFGMEPPKEEEEVNQYADFDPDEYNRRNRKNSWERYGGDRNGGNRGGSGNRDGDSRGGSGQDSNSGKRQFCIEKITSLSEGPHAPYNFVPIGDKVMEDPNRMAYSVISDDTYTGEIRYAVKAITPILVDSGNDEFYRNKDGKCAMPGSTMRGLIRNNLQILSFSDVRDDIDDYKLMYRAVAGGCLQEPYDNTLGVDSNKQNSKKKKNSDDDSGPQKVRAGYIVQEGGRYSLYGHIGDRDHIFVDENKPNYFTLDEKEILDDKKKRARFQDIVGCFMNYEDRKDDYVPYSEGITYEIVENQNGKPKVCAVSKGDVLPEPGFVLGTGKMDKKKAFYVIPGIDRENCIKKTISDADIAAYQADYNRKKSHMKTDAEEKFYSLPVEGEEPRPVFYIDIGEALYFGFTPHLRIFFEHSIRDGINQQPLDSGLDFAKSMFGFAKDDEAEKSKVFFTDAVLQGEERSAGSKDLILSEPKPTSFLEYLEQGNDKKDKEVKTYNSEDMKFRGIKQYWLHEEITEGESSGSDEMKSTINPLAEDSRFEGSIRFQNLSKEELGLLLWSLELEDGCRMNVGKAKPYGYGQIEIDNVELSLVDPKAAYFAKTDILSDDPLKKSEDDKKKSFIDAYKDFLSKWLNGDIMKNPTISAFLGMKRKPLGGTAVEYMKLDEYSKFNKPDSYNPLPTVQEIIESGSPQND